MTDSASVVRYSQLYLKVRTELFGDFNVISTSYSTGTGTLISDAWLVIAGRLGGAQPHTLIKLYIHNVEDMGAAAAGHYKSGQDRHFCPLTVWSSIDVCR